MKHLRQPSQVAEMSADQITQALVDDFVRGVHTPLPAFLAGIRALAERRRMSEENVYQSIRAEAQSLGGKASLLFDVPTFT